jgi:hypothetical protein
VPAAPLRPALQQVRWPQLDYLVVVEGWNDAKAVSAATGSQVRTAAWRIFRLPHLDAIHSTPAWRWN